MITYNRVVAIFILSMLLCLHSSGCGYKMGFLIPTDVRSVSVQVATNNTFWRDAIKTDNLNTDRPLSGPRPAYPMEVDLTERLRNEIVRRTPLKLANDEDADSILRTTITSVKPNVLVRDAADNVLSERITIDVSFDWIDRRTGRILARADDISRPTDFTIARGESFTSAARRSFDYIAERIVECMQEGF